MALQSPDIMESGAEWKKDAQILGLRHGHAMAGEGLRFVADGLILSKTSIVTWGLRPLIVIPLTE